MESYTKNHQSDEVLRALIESAFGPDQVPDEDGFAEELTEGWFNVAYRIRLRDGQQVVLKIAPPADVPVLTREQGMMRSELEAMRLISERTTVPIPKVLHADLNHQIVDADLFFMEYVDADNFGVGAEDGQFDAETVAAANRSLGELNRQINAVTGDHFGPLLGEGSATWREAFLAIVHDTLADGRRAGVDLGWTEQEILDVVNSHAHTLDEVTVPRLVEVDMWEKNSMIRAGEIVSILDHERAVWGDPLMEAGFTGLDLPEFTDPTDFIEGYGAGPFTEEERTRRRLYSLQLGLIMLVETKYRGTEEELDDFSRRQLDSMMQALGAPASN